MRTLLDDFLGRISEYEVIPIDDHIPELSLTLLDRESSDRIYPPLDHICDPAIRVRVGSSSDIRSHTTGRSVTREEIEELFFCEVGELVEEFESVLSPLMIIDILLIFEMRELDASFRRKIPFELGFYSGSTK